MSYSFQVTDETKDGLKTKVEAELQKALSSQPRHSEIPVVQATVESFLSLMPDSPPEGQQFRADVVGSVGWRDETALTHLSANINIYFMVVRKDMP